MPCAGKSFDLETAAELVQTKAYGSLPSETPTTDNAARAPSEIPPASSESHSANSAAGESPSASGLETTPPTGASAVTLRDRAEERKRKRQEGKKDDWFTTQGRYIVIGFFVALAVTIYIARTRRQPAGPPIAAKPQATSVKVAGPATNRAAVKPASAIEPAKITSVRPAGSAATAAKAATASEPKTALHPPTIPQLPSEPADKGAPAEATLFTFTRRTEERVATRTDVPISSDGAARVPSTSGAAPASGAPTLQPFYPTTNYPRQDGPAGPAAGQAPPYSPAAATYSPPGASYVPPSATYAPPAAPAGPALGPAASTMPLYPTTNQASGYRHERTGSSVY